MVLLDDTNASLLGSDALSLARPFKLGAERVTVSTWSEWLGKYSQNTQARFLENVWKKEKKMAVPVPQASDPFKFNHPGYSS